MTATRVVFVDIVVVCDAVVLLIRVAVLVVCGRWDDDDAGELGVVVNAPTHSPLQ